MDTAYDQDEQLRITLERDFQSLDLNELKSEREKIVTKNQHIQNELSDLAFHNYRTYVDVGRTAEYCKEKFSAIDETMHQLRTDFPNLLDNINQFKESSHQVMKEFKMLDEVESNNCLIWEILKLPKLMEKCIKTGRYEQAYAMTNFAVAVKQTKLIQNQMLKNVVDYLLEAIHSLLDELFSKFSGPLDLASSIQVVNNIRKIPYISNTQLRVTILQYRDMYLEKKVHSIMSESDFILQVIEVYRECMYDTIVLYLAVFPDADIQRKFISMNDDSRWERWTGSSQNYLLQSWAQHNIEKLFTIIRGAECKTFIDMETMISKLMSFAFSFGRMGLDFRPLIHNEFSQMIIEIFRKKVEMATKNFIDPKKLDLIDGDIFESTRRQLEDDAGHDDLIVLSAPLELCIWDDLCIFGNSIIDALNDIRHSLCINFVRQIFRIILASFHATFGWLDSHLATTSSEEIPLVKKAIYILLRHFVPYINQCFFHCFPYEHCARQHFRSGYCSLEEYNKAFSFMTSNLFAYCRHEMFSQIFGEVENEVKQQQQQSAKDDHEDDEERLQIETDDQHDENKTMTNDQMMQREGEEEVRENSADNPSSVDTEKENIQEQTEGEHISTLS